MAAVPKKKNFLYKEEDMIAALEDVRNGMSKRAAAAQHSVPRSSLVRRAAGKVPEGRVIGPAPILSEVEEKAIEEWLLNMARKGYPIHRTILLDTVKKCLDDAKRKTVFTENRPGRSWWLSFKKRHPKIAEKEAESLTKARALTTENSIRQWFKEVEEWLKKNDLFRILDDPSRIFNADESGFLLCPKTGKVICEKGSGTDSYRITSNNDKEQLTVMAAFSADGETVAPMVVYPYKRIPNHIMKFVPERWAVGISDKGWMNGEVFFEWVANHFIPHLEKEKIQFPVVLFVDGHRSHITMQVSEMCDAKGVVLIALHPNCTHILQPADVSVFRPLKVGWKEKVREWKFKHDFSDVTRVNFAPLIDEVFIERAKPITVQNGFRACGLYPFDAEAVNYSKCLKSRPEISTNDLQESYTLTCSKLSYLESKIDSTTLEQFKNTKGSWSGDSNAHDLFIVWKAFVDDSKISEELRTNNRDQENTDETHNRHPTSPLFSPRASPELDQLPSTLLPPEELIGDEISTFLPHEELIGDEISTFLPPEELIGDEISATLTPPVGPISATEITPVCSGQSTAGSSSSLEKYKCNQLSSPFKACLIFPKTSQPNPAKRRIRFPSVVSSSKFREFIVKEEEKSKAKKAAKRPRKSTDIDMEIPASKKGKQLLKKNKKSDWLCKKCKASWNGEVKSGIASKWIECETCTKWFHARCVSKKHREDFGFVSLCDSDNTDSEDDVVFICEKCAHLDPDEITDDSH